MNKQQMNKLEQLNRHNQRAALMDKVEALKLAEARLFGQVVEHIGPLSQWPIHTLEQMLSTHLTYQPRLNLTLFALGNHCAPDLYSEWLLIRNMLKDQPARLHVASLIKLHKTGQLGRMTTYMLPFRVTAPPKPVSERKHRWDGVGDPMPRGSPSSAFVFPVETPDISIIGGAHWDHAYNMLTENSGVHFPVLTPLQYKPEIKITPIRDPDDLDEDGDLTDMYGVADGFMLAEHMDMQVTLYESVPSGRKRPLPACLSECAPKKPRAESSSAVV